MKRIASFILLFFCLSTPLLSQNISLSPEAKVSLLTCGTGNESYALFGHTAVRVKDSIQGIDMVYNYGAFDFSTPNFVAKFAKGDLKYFVVVHDFSDFMMSYSSEKRSVYEQELMIPFTQKQAIFEKLNHSLLTEDRYYTYKFIDKNCTTMVVDLFNQVLGATTITKQSETDVTFREVLYPYFEGHFYERLGTSIIFGTKVDQKATHIFLPFELKNNLAKTKYNNQNLASPSVNLLSFEKEKINSWWNNWYSYLILLGLLLILNKKAVDFLFIGILGVLGLFFISMGFYSDHQELANNYNILLFNPLSLILLVFVLLKNKKIVYNLAVLELILVVIYGIYIANKPYFLITLPLITTTILILLRIAWHNKKIPIVI